MEDLLEKLKILADAAKFDVSCSSSGTSRGNTGKVGSAMAMGCCHSWSADGRCISLLKILFTNKCEYDCEYCVNRRTADVARASLEPEELARLTIEFYRRNYIEGLFLSSAVEVSPDYTTERMLKALILLREQYGFAGYIHAKIIPGVSPELTHRIGLLADRLSVNIELPTDDSLRRLAPQKKSKNILLPMRQITETIQERKALKVSGGSSWAPETSFLDPAGDVINLALPQENRGRHGKKETFAPAGQTTQMIIGASPETDRQIIKSSESLYQTFQMKRVYFSAYVARNESPLLPDLTTAPPLLREHRLYQADWLLRFYGFSADEILDEASPHLDLELDPKIAWALRNIHLFPIEINKASMEELLRIPGIGAVSAQRIIRQRRMAAVKFDDLKKLGVVVKRAKYFILCIGRYYGGLEIAPERIRNRILSPEDIRNGLLPINNEIQISMFQQESARLLSNPKLQIT